MSKFVFEKEITVPTAFSGLSSFSGHVFGPLKNPLNEELKDSEKSEKIFLKYFKVKSKILSYAWKYSRNLNFHQKYF